MALGFLFFLGFTPAEACTPADGSGAVINEVYADPPGADAGLEWVELTLSGDRAAADLTGWTIAAGTRSLTSGVGFPPRELAPGTFAVIGNQEGLPALGNAGSGSADVVQLRDCAGVVADTVVYGAPNTDGFVDDLGTEATSLAPAPNPGGSIGRTPDGHDTDQSSDDFVRFDVPSPGAPNPLPPPCTSGSGVVINELLVNPEGADDPKEFVELHGAGPDPVELGGWSLVASTRSDTERSVVVPMDVAVEPGGFLVIGGSGRPDSHVVATLGLGNGDGTDGLRLVDCEGRVHDTVVYGEPDNHDGIVDDAGFVDDPYGHPQVGEVLARRLDGVDSDSARDWVVRDRATPGASNRLPVVDAAPPGGCGGAPEVRPVPEPREPTGCVLAPASAGLGLVLLACGVTRRATSRPAAGR